MATLLKFGGVQIGDYVERYYTSVVRAGDPEVQQGVLRLVAKIDDQSPNILFQVRVLVYKKAGSAIALNRWVVTKGGLAKNGKQELRIEEAADTFVMPDAVMLTPIELPNELNVAAGKDTGIVFIFQSEQPPA